jgi:hypothetical protein
VIERERETERKGKSKKLKRERKKERKESESERERERVEGGRRLLDGPSAVRRTVAPTLKTSSRLFLAPKKCRIRKKWSSGQSVRSVERGNSVVAVWNVARASHVFVCVEVLNHFDSRKKPKITSLRHFFSAKTQCTISRDPKK